MNCEKMTAYINSNILLSREEKGQKAISCKILHGFTAFWLILRTAFSYC